MAELGNPIISTSAKKSDDTIIYDPSHIHEYFGSRLAIVIDGGPVPGQPSSVISLIDDIPEIIREGMGDVNNF